MRFHPENVILYLFLVLSILFLWPLARKNRVPGAKVVLSIFLVLTIVMTIPLLLMAQVMGSIPNPPKPEIMRAEFPFSLTYQLNGITATLEDTLICKYTGWDCNLEVSSTKYRTWSSSYGSKQSRPVLLRLDDVETAYMDGKWIETGPYTVTFTLSVPNDADYYMGDSDTEPNYFGSDRDRYKEEQQERAKFPSIQYQITKDGRFVHSKWISGEEIYDSDLLTAYGLRVISWSPPQPIENTFH